MKPDGWVEAGQKSPHEQVMVKVNAQCDKGIQPLVEALSSIPKLITLESCQQRNDLLAAAWVCFRYAEGDTALFGLVRSLAAHLARMDPYCSYTLRLEWFGADEYQEPMGELFCHPDNVAAVAAHILLFGK